MRLHSRRSWLAALVALVIGASLSGCKKAGQTATDSAAHPQESAAHELTEAEVQFGVSPKLDSRVTYQPDVIVMEHGAEAVRSQSSDGFTWSIDAGAQGASQIQPGKILFATGRVVGRVSKVERNGANFDVTLGPVTLTDVIKDAHIDYADSLDPAQMIVYVAPKDYPGTTIDLNAPEPSPPNATSYLRHEHSPGRVYVLARNGKLVPLHGRFAEQLSRPPCADSASNQFVAIPAVYFDSQHDPQGISGCAEGPGFFSGNLLRVARPIKSDIPSDLAKVLIGGFLIVPSLNGGLGSEISYGPVDGMKFKVHARLRLTDPKFIFKLDISNGVLRTAAIELSGVGGFDIGIEGAMSGEKFSEDSNVNRSFAIPVDISFPMKTFVPFSATYHQSILVHTMFTAKQAEIQANGDYAMEGKITAGIINGSPAGSASLKAVAKQNLANSLSGASLGVNGLVVGYGGKIIVGIGALGLVAGPYASINLTAGITRGSDLQTAVVAYTCGTAVLNIFLGYGVGFAIPAWSASIINAFLGVLHIAPIESSYGTELGQIDIKSFSEAVPPSCAAK